MPEVIKPSIPYTGDIPGGIKPGSVVTITGSVEHSCSRFIIDFQCGSEALPQSEIAFHFNPRFDQDCVVVNSFEKGSWQHEKKRELPFRKGYPFQIQFSVSNISYKVVVDGQHFLDFEHRIPLHKVDTLCISGGVEVDSIKFQPTTSG